MITLPDIQSIPPWAARLFWKQAENEKAWARLLALHGKALA